MAHIVRALIAVLVIALVLQLGTAIVGSFAESNDGLRLSKSEAALLGDTGEFASIRQGDGFNETVYDSRGNAINLSGSSDSFVESNADITFSDDDTWTVATWAHVDADAASETMTAVSINGRLTISYNGTDGNWTAWYYDEGSRDSFRVNVSAPDQPGTLTSVIVVSNGTHLSIYQNNSEGDVKNITSSNIAGAPVNDTNWDGRIDETRSFDDALNTSQRQSLVDSPVAPLTGTNRTMRIMYDQPDKSVQLIFFTGAGLETSNVTYSEGLAGSELTAGTDYEWDTEGPRIKPLSGGLIDGAPVAYVDYKFEGALSSLVRGWSHLVALGALIPLVVIVGLILLRVRGL